MGRPNKRFQFLVSQLLSCHRIYEDFKNTSGACKAEFDKIVRSILAEGRKFVSYIKQDVSYLGGPTDL